MTYEKSCGGIIYTEEDGVRRYLIIESIGGAYGFPKGHMEGNETEVETALREIGEEVGIHPTLIEDFKLTDEYPLPGKEGVGKQITYFVGTYADQEIIPLESELVNATLMTYEEAMNVFQFESSKRLLEEAERFLESKK